MAGGTYLGWGVPTQAGVLTLVGGYLPWPGGNYHGGGVYLPRS